MIPILAGLYASITWLVFNHNVNWDEFHYLSKVHQYVNGEPMAALQTFHVHLYRWIAWLPPDEMLQVTAARTTVLLFLLGTTALVYVVARTFVAPSPALCGSLAFLASGFVVGHGASFRPDPIAAFLLMLALALAFTSRLTRWQLLALSVSVAVATLVTIKAVLYAPAFLAALVWRRSESRIATRAFVVALLAPSLLAVLFLVHRELLAVEGHRASDFARNALNTTVLGGTFLPRAPTVALWFALSAGPLILVVCGLFGPRRRALTSLLLVTPLLSVLFYRNAFPYFFPFIVPPAMVVAAIGAANLSKARLLLWDVLLLATLGAVGQILTFAGEDQHAQRDLLATVHRAFPQPVPYIDRNSMISTFPKAGFFMSTWGVEKYRRAGTPIFADIIASRSPPLLLTNGVALLAAMRGARDDLLCCRLLKEDEAVLRRSYVHYRGDVWLAGRRLQVDAAPREVTMPISGEYKVRGDEPILIDGRVVEPGQVVLLDTTGHRISAAGPTTTTLIWNTLPPLPLPDGWAPIYYPFWDL